MTLNYFDLIGAFLSLWCTYLFINTDPKAWPLSALALPFDAYAYLEKGLYGDLLLQGVYLITTLYGWHQWRHGGKDKKQLPISTVAKEKILVTLGLTVVAILLVHYFLASYNQASIAWLDAITTVLSLLGQWLLCNKKLETWIIWLIVDALYFYLYAIKGLPFHALMVSVYFAMAIIGWLKWKAQWRQAIIKPVRLTSSLNNL